MEAKNLEYVYKIIYGNERPSKKAKLSNAEYKNLFLKIPKVNLNTIPKFEIKFSKPLPEIRKYYFQSIHNSIIAAINELEMQIESETELERFHTIDQYIPRKLNSLLKDLNEEIVKSDLKLFYYLNLKNSNISESIANEIYVFQCLKYYIIYFYNHIQIKYPAYLEENILTLEEINDTFFKEEYSDIYIVPNNQYKEIKVVKEIEETRGIESNEIFIKPKLPIHKCDIRINSKVIAYDELIRNPVKFSNFEQLLFDYGYIDENYEFIENHGKKKEMAFIFNILIKKNYFYEMSFPSKTEIKRIEIRNFLNTRYCSKIEKQFNDLNNKPDLVEQFQNSHSWLDNLPSC